MHKVDLESLDTLEKTLQFEPRQHDDAVSAVGTGVGDDDERVDVRHGQQADEGPRLDALLPPTRVLVPPDLHQVRDDVAVRHHDRFLCALC